MREAGGPLVTAIADLTKDVDGKKARFWPLLDPCRTRPSIPIRWRRASIRSAGPTCGRAEAPGRVPDDWQPESAMVAQPHDPRNRRVELRQDVHA